MQRSETKPNITENIKQLIKQLDDRLRLKSPRLFFHAQPECKMTVSASHLMTIIHRRLNRCFTLIVFGSLRKENLGSNIMIIGGRLGWLVGWLVGFYDI